MQGSRHCWRSYVPCLSGLLHWYWWCCRNKSTIRIIGEASENKCSQYCVTLMLAIGWLIVKAGGPCHRHNSIHSLCMLYVPSLVDLPVTVLAIQETPFLGMKLAASCVRYLRKGSKHVDTIGIHLLQQHHTAAQLQTRLAQQHYNSTASPLVQPHTSASLQ